MHGEGDGQEDVEQAPHPTSLLPGAHDANTETRVLHFVAELR